TAHLAGRPVGEGDRKDLLFRNDSGGDRVSNTVRDGKGFAGARSGEDAHGPTQHAGRLGLLRVESLQNAVGVHTAPACGRVDCFGATDSQATAVSEYASYLFSIPLR